MRELRGLAAAELQADRMFLGAEGEVPRGDLTPSGEPTREPTVLSS